MFSRTKLEFRLIWNKIFQKEDEELGWLLNPYNSGGDATPMTTFTQNFDGSSTYQARYEDVRAGLGREKVTIYSTSISKKTPKNKQNKKDKETYTETAIKIARYMGMGVYMTSTAFPSPFAPFNENHMYDDYYSNPTNNVYSMSKIW